MHGLHDTLPYLTLPYLVPYLRCSTQVWEELWYGTVGIVVLPSRSAPYLKLAQVTDSQCFDDASSREAEIPYWTPW